ncbi:hypothetical protein Tco_0360762 [Tanacetum coccineum]
MKSSVSTEGVEELKRIVKIKGVKKKALHSLRQKPEHPSETIGFHNEDGNPARANIKQALGYLKVGDGDGNSHGYAVSSLMDTAYWSLE